MSFMSYSLSPMPARICGPNDSALKRGLLLAVACSALFGTVDEFTLLAIVDVGDAP